MPRKKTAHTPKKAQAGSGITLALKDYFFLFIFALNLTMSVAGLILWLVLTASKDISIELTVYAFSSFIVFGGFIYYYRGDFRKWRELHFSQKYFVALLINSAFTLVKFLVLFPSGQSLTGEFAFSSVRSIALGSLGMTWALSGLAVLMLVLKRKAYHLSNWTGAGIAAAAGLGIVLGATVLGVIFVTTSMSVPENTDFACADYCYILDEESYYYVTPGANGEYVCQCLNENQDVTATTVVSG